VGTVLDVFLNPVLLVPIIAWLLAQVLKVIINSLMNRRLTLSRLVGDGGMPSGHSATVTSLAAMCGIECGFVSVEFAIAAVLAVIVMHDATGVRRETGKQAESIISIVSVINNYLVEKDEELKTEKLKILVGHTHLQVVCGAILGILVAIGYFFIFKN
jgi:acid phosphatase family membrane protein YuiD